MKFEIMSALEVPQLRINAMVNFDPEQLSKILHSHNLDHRHKNMLMTSLPCTNTRISTIPTPKARAPSLKTADAENLFEKGNVHRLFRCARFAVARSRPATHVSAFKPPCRRDEMHTGKLWSFEKTSIDSLYDDMAILRGGAEMKCRGMFDA
jgi:hypothetical protein